MPRNLNEIVLHKFVFRIQNNPNACLFLVFNYCNTQCDMYFVQWGRRLESWSITAARLEESFPAGCDFVRDGLSSVHAACPDGPHHLPRSGADLLLNRLNVHKTQTWATSRKEGMAWYSSIDPCPLSGYVQCGWRLCENTFTGTGGDAQCCSMPLNPFASNFLKRGYFSIIF